ncbi:hypothetical protein AB1A65_11055 [Muricauda sp. ANG21]|uniref:hypothetical protein n=1 Tax=Allomuricauda sp. ANG21 TaxID=3042468 RepID=UPI003456B5FA
MKRFVGLLVILTLMLVKVSAFHIYSHQDCDSDTIENCNDCYLALVSQASDFDAPEDIQVVVNLYFTDNAQQLSIVEQFNGQSCNLFYFSRPPPRHKA